MRNISHSKAQAEAAKLQSEADQSGRNKAAARSAQSEADKSAVTKHGL